MRKREFKYVYFACVDVNVYKKLFYVFEIALH